MDDSVELKKEPVAEPVTEPQEPVVKQKKPYWTDARREAFARCQAVRQGNCSAIRESKKQKALDETVQALESKKKELETLPNEAFKAHQVRDAKYKKPLGRPPKKSKITLIEDSDEDSEDEDEYVVTKVKAPKAVPKQRVPTPTPQKQTFNYNFV